MGIPPRGGGKIAFTMAEILLSLTIISVVAAITLPSLTGNINERTWNTQRKALYARMSQAISLMPALNGYGTLDETTDTAAETFVTAGLSKVMKINNICDSEHLENCGIPNKFTSLNGNIVELNNIKTLTDFNSRFEASFSGYPKYTQLNSKAAAFETQNGESILVYYNPSCIGNLLQTSTHFIQPYMCANFIYDLNGNKGPNTVGKDIGFMTAIYPTDSEFVAPMPLTKNLPNAHSQIDAGKYCTKEDNSRLPNRYEIASMFYNDKLVNIASDGLYWSNTVISAGGNGKGWAQSFYAGRIYNYDRSTPYLVRCIKR